MRPLIGITTGHFLRESAADQRQSVFVGCAAAYVAEVVRAGGLAVLLPPIADRDAVRTTVAAVDGLLLTGRGDIAPLQFGAQPHPKTRLIDPVRDRMEIEAARAAVKRDMPMLGICRGIQLINVARGGDLVQDIPTQVKRAIRHASSDLAPCLSHTIHIKADSLLASLIGAGETAVHSNHHQAVGRLGKGLRIVAKAPDGVIEAIEADDGGSILGVQFHPEQAADEHPQFRAIFDWLVAQARRFRRSRK